MKIKVSIFLTWSKIMAFIILILAFVLDIHTHKDGAVFMFSVPFVVFLITGKQFFDKDKPDKNN